MNLSKKIAAASKRIGGRLATDKRNDAQGYEYISADSALAACGQALAEEGVAVFPSVANWGVTQFATPAGKTRYDAHVDLVFDVTCEGESVKQPWVGLGSDYTSPDKAVYSAITSGHRYFLVKLLNVGAFNEDSEHASAPEDMGTGTTVPMMGAAPHCPKCGSPMWDNRTSKKNPRAPDFKCKNKSCDGAVWQDSAHTPAPTPAPASSPGGPMAPNDLRPWLLGAAEQFTTESPLSDGWKKAVIGHLTRLTGGENGRHKFLAWVFGEESSTDLSERQWHALRAWLDIQKTDDGQWRPSELAIAEAKMAMAALLTSRADDALPF